MSPFRYRPSSAADSGPAARKGPVDAHESHATGSTPSKSHLQHSHLLARPTTAPGSALSATAPMVASTNGTHAHLKPRPSFNRAHSSGPHPGAPPSKSPSAATGSGITATTSSTSLCTNASEAWTNPEESDGEFVRRTYLYFDLYGVKGDGTAEGREWTRNRDAAQTPWNELREGAPQRSRSQRSRVKSTPASPGSQTNGRLSPASAAPRRPNATTRPSPLARPPTIPTSPVEELSSDTTLAPVPAPAPPLPSTPEPAPSSSRYLDPHARVSPVMTHTRLSDTDLSEVSEIGTDEWADHRETEKRKRKELSTQRFGGVGAGADGQDGDEDGEGDAERWKMLDRYGFFAQEWASLHGRISILPAAAFSFVPTPGAPGKTKGKAAAASRAARGVIEGSNGHPAQVGATTSSSTTSLPDVLTSMRLSGNDTSRQKEQRRIAKWAKMLEPGEQRGGNTAFFQIRQEYVDSPKLLSRVIKGIPDRWRAAAWWAMLEIGRGGEDEKAVVEEQAREADPVADSSSPPRRTMKRTLSAKRNKTTSSQGADATSTAKPPTTRRRKDRHEPLSSAILRRKRQDHLSRYHRLLGVSSPHDVQIDLDVPRTISNHIQFHTRYGQGQRSLFKVLHSFSLLCQDCGYCQGMGSLCVTLLCYFPEEVAYSVLVSLHDNSTKFNLHQIFYPGFPGLMEQFHVQEHLMKLLLPSDLLLNLESEGITTSSYATRWYITNFYNVVPFETQLQLWDLFFLIGKDVLPIFAVAILHSLSLTVFRKGQEYDFEHFMSHLNHLFVPQSDEKLFAWIGAVLGDRRIRREIEGARDEWRRGGGV